MKNRTLIASVVLLWALGLAVVAYAAIATATWTNATQNTDGTAIPATGDGSLTSTTVEWSSCGPGDTFTTVAGSKTVAASLTTLQTPNLAPGRWCFRAFHTNSYGINSDAIGPVVKVVDPPKPKPPGNFSIG